MEEVGVAARGSAVEAGRVACGENHEVLMTEGNPKGKRSAVNLSNLEQNLSNSFFMVVWG